MIDTFGAFFIILLAGALWQFVPSLPDKVEVRSGLVAVVLNIFFPALGFIVLYKAPISAEFWQIPVLSAGIIIIPLCLSWASYKIVIALVARFSSGRKDVAPVHSATLGALLLASAWGNISYLGLPVITDVFGSQYQRIPILFDLLGHTPLLLTVGTFIGGMYGVEHSSRHKQNKEQGADSVARIVLNGLKAIATLPPFWGACLGILFNLLQIPLPAMVQKGCNLMGAAVAPMMIFAVGLALRFHISRQVLWIIPALVVKLIVSPIIGLAIATAISMEPDILEISVVESGMPVMVLSMAIADKYALDSETLAMAIALSTLLAFITLPLVVSFMG